MEAYDLLPNFRADLELAVYSVCQKSTELTSLFTGCNCPPCNALRRCVHCLPAATKASCCWHKQQSWPSAQLSRVAETCNQQLPSVGLLGGLRRAEAD